MKTRDICQGIINGTITLDFQGHLVNGGWSYKKSVQNFYDRCVEMENGGGDGTWNACEKEGADVENINTRMRKHFHSKLEDAYADGEAIEFDFPEMKCSHCAKKLFWRRDGNKLILDRFFNYDTSLAWSHHIQPVEGGCEFKDLQCLSGSIQVNSRLIFANYFRFEDTPDNSKYTDEYGLNFLIGRKNITEFKAEKQNVAYGQTTNCSIGIYISKDRKTICIANAYLGEDDGEGNMEYESEQAEAFVKEHDFLGDISCDVWRWEATDLNTITQPILDELKAEQRQDFVEVDVPHGTWKFEHYYDIQDEPFIYSKFVLSE